MRFAFTLPVVASFATIFVFASCSSSPATSSADAGDAATSETGTITPPEDGSVSADCLEGGAGVTLDGWTRVIGKDFVAAKQGNVMVAVVYSVPIDDTLRYAPHFAEALWDKLLADDYTAGTRASGGDGAYELPYTSGPATDKATGEPVFITVTGAKENGTTFPVVVVAPDEASSKALLPTPESISEMRRYNYFPLTCTKLAGHWTSSSVDAVETYDATGSFTGLKISSLRIDLRFDDASNYTMDATVTTNTGSQKENDQGSFTAADGVIAMTSAAGLRNKTYNAGFVGVRGGVALYIVDQQFSGDSWLLYRAK